MIFHRSDAVFLTLNAVLVAVLLTDSQCANADTYLHTGAVSKHFAASRDYNEVHHLAAVEYNGYLGGYFRNSLNGDTVFIASRWRKDLGYDVEGSVIIGASYGYKADCLRPEESGATMVCPLAVPAITYTGARVQPSVSMIGNAVTFSIRWKL